MTLLTHHLEFTATAVTPLELDDQAGASIRGAVVGGLWDRFCVNKAAPTCAACPLVRVCPVAALVAPMREDGETGGGQRPRPYVVRPPAGGGRRYAPGESLAFGIGLIGPVAQLFPYVFMAAQEIERSGLGRRLAANSGRRGALQIESIAAVNPLIGARQPLFQRGHPQVQAPGLPIAPADVAAYAAALPIRSLTLHFQTPLRLTEKRDGETRLVHRFELRPFFARLAWRLDELARAYGEGVPISDYQSLPALVEQVGLADDQTRWVDVVSYSSRTRQRTPIGGLVGRVTLVGDLAPLRELLVWGSLVHVGKNAVKGDGWYTVGGDGG
jgi:hypothetical protein